MTTMPRGALGLLAGLILLTGCGVSTSEPNPEPQPEGNRPLEKPRRDTSVRDQQIRAHHDLSILQFTRSAGFGFGRMLTPIHRPTTYPSRIELASGESLSETEVWGVTKHELIGLMNPADAGVYPSNKMNHYEKKPHKRPLDAFESHALTKLRNGEEVVIEEMADGYLRVVGALRLGKGCVECHLTRDVPNAAEAVPDIREGHLMGAFSYELRRGVIPPSDEPPLNPLARPMPPVLPEAQLKRADP